MSKINKKKSKTNEGKKNITSKWIAGIVIGLFLIGMVVLVLRQQKNTSDSTISDTSTVSLDKSLGNENAPVVVVEYGDYQCPACGRFASTEKPKLVEEFVKTGKVRFVFRSFQFIGEESFWAAEAAECANEQGKYWEYYEKLYSSQEGENIGTFGKVNLEKFANELGLQTKQFNECLASGKFSDKVKAETLEAQNLGLRGTPSLIVNGELVDEGNQYEILREKILELLSSMD
ncbi:MAG: disulfide bond formation protein DsbA [Chloroflexi bacterium HGW-Chloroflexi-4]|jgi:protein-disulfide isomerase|nr:MAG: disulfide bond formation protein DsbA [Chloroflexi bacterium HGW-Chloroflexi-4]